jgi:alpha-amylase/alpha-mannosidase (GH57 family)
MPRIYLCFLWHMHQPFYKDLISGEYRLPWTRMHALKDYYGMVKILEEFPQVRQTFNLVPSMMVQVEEYAAGKANDPFLAAALKPAEQLTNDEQAFILRNFFMANPGKMIYRYPRFGELHTAVQAQKALAGSRSALGAQDFRDLQVLSQVAWFDEEFLEHDPDVRGLVAKGRNFSLEDQALMGVKQREILDKVIPQYRKLAATGQIEISTTPFYHPILPLLCDSDIAQVAHPHVPLPPRFRYPNDARLQLQRAREYIGKTFGVAPVGLWPSEGSVSDEALAIAAETGFEWAATDNGVLERTLNRGASPDVTYRPYEWRRDGHKIRMIFRDHLMSDLIGFVYSGMDSGAAARDFLRRIRENCSGILSAGRDAMVPIILDGENAWEYYDRNGRPFFRELYGGIQADPGMEAITVSEAFRRIRPEPLLNIFPGSWINANFDVWIGAEEDNKAWRLLLDARRAYDEASKVSPNRRKLALEELFIAEGSDWNWWYGPEHHSDNREEFDQIYREHLANVYRALGVPTPPELSQSILRTEASETYTLPTQLIRPVVDGLVGSYFEWMGSGSYGVDQRSGAMHGKRTLLREVRYGSDGVWVYVRIDFAESGAQLNGLEVQVHPETGTTQLAIVRLVNGAAVLVRGEANQILAAWQEVLEIGIRITNKLKGIRLSFWQDGLPIQSVPQDGSFRAELPETDAWSIG